MAAGALIFNSLSTAERRELPGNRRKHVLFRRSEEVFANILQDMSGGPHGGGSIGSISELGAEVDL